MTAKKDGKSFFSIKLQKSRPKRRPLDLLNLHRSNLKVELPLYFFTGLHAHVSQLQCSFQGLVNRFKKSDNLRH